MAFLNVHARADPEDLQKSPKGKPTLESTLVLTPSNTLSMFLGT